MVTKADTINKIIKNNADPKDELIYQSNEFKNKSIELNDKIGAVKTIAEKVDKGIEMHKLMAKLVTFVEKNRNKVRNDMPKQEILDARVAELDQMSILIKELPMKKELDQVNTLEKQTDALLKNLTEMMSK